MKQLNASLNNSIIPSLLLFFICVCLPIIPTIPLFSYHYCCQKKLTYLSLCFRWLKKLKKKSFQIVVGKNSVKRGSYVQLYFFISIYFSNSSTYIYFIRVSLSSLFTCGLFFPVSSCPCIHISLFIPFNVSLSLLSLHLISLFAFLYLSLNRNLGLFEITEFHD